MKTIYNWIRNEEEIRLEMWELQKKINELNFEIGRNTVYDITQEETIEGAFDYIKDNYGDLLEEDDGDNYLPDSIEIQIKDWTTYKIWMEGESVKHRMDCWPHLYRIEGIERIWIIKEEW